MISTLKSYVWGAVASLIALLSAALWWTAKSRNRATQAAREAEGRAQANEAARNHVQEATEATNEVDDDIRGMSDSDVDRQLREYARDTDAGN